MRDPPGASEHGYPEHLLGSRAGRPEFAMLSLDSTVAVLGTTWEAGISYLAMPDPGDTKPVQRRLDWAATRVWDPREEWFMGAPRTEREEALAWLRHDEPAIRRSSARSALPTRLSALARCCSAPG
ncbi:hypothetical protein OHA98_20545 [Streptomyces sp. NBC_00654]|uniref:hypothetical protein n=1 Tax=Streptomyces sp. NBC_00654 TaxID=2975799 RepID=UPI002252F481|nr:hypothetical protein [Streptomyces sp. NBC_00654]MCX4967135.1 hypothetical protein [Streptomyces sp. NBC_00654]